MPPFITLSSEGGFQQIHCLPPALQGLLKVVTDLSKAFALAVPAPEAIRIRDDVAFFQAVGTAIVKSTATAGKSEEDLDQAIRQIVSRAIAAEGVVDIFSAAGRKKPDISILDDEFLSEVQGMPQRNLAGELLRKLLNDELKTQSRKNLIQSRSEMLEGAVRRYHSRAIETVQVIEELIGLARDMRTANKRGEDLKLSDDEIAFYDALEVNDSAVAVLGNENLRVIARELVAAVRANATIDWTLKESVRAKIRVIVKRICANMVTRRINRRKQRRPFWSKLNCFVLIGRRNVDEIRLSTVMLKTLS